MKTMRSFLKLCRPYRWLLAAALLFELAYSAITLSTSEVLRITTGAIETGRADRLPFVAGLAVLATVLTILFDFAEALLGQQLTNRCEEHVQTLLLRQLLRLTKRRRMEIPTGEVVAKTAQNVPQAVEGTVDTLYSLVEGFGGIVFGAAYMAWFSWRLAACIVLFNVLFRLATRFYDRKIRTASRRGVGYKNRNSSFVIELLHLNPLIQVFGRQRYFQRRFSDYETESLHNDVRVFALQNSYSELQWMTKKFAEIGILYGYGGWLVAHGQLSFSVVIAFTTASDYFAKGIQSLIWGISAKNGTVPYIQAITGFLADPAVEDAAGILPPRPEYALRLEHVSFRYGQRPVLEDVNLTVRPGEWVRIVGPNGQGKSTLLELILGFYRPDAGAVYYGGQDIRRISQASLAERYSYIPQSPHILEGSVAQNLALTETPAPARCARILERLNLMRIRDSRPASLSTGEKQRLCIGRALYRLPDTPLILGDEIFSNVDRENREAIARVLAEACRGKTVLFVCHEDMGLTFDKTIVVDHGKAVTEPCG